MEPLCIKKAALSELIERVLEEKIYHQISNNSHLPPSLHLLKNPFPSEVVVKNFDGTETNGGLICFLGVDPNRANLPLNRVKVYIIPADPANPSQPKDYSNPISPTPQ